MTLGELIDMLAPPPEVVLQQEVMRRVHLMNTAAADVREQALMSGAMPSEFRVLIRMDRSNRFYTRFDAVLG